MTGEACGAERFRETCSGVYGLSRRIKWIEDAIIVPLADPNPQLMPLVTGLAERLSSAVDAACFLSNQGS